MGGEEWIYKIFFTTFGFATYARRNKACVFFLLQNLKLGLSPEIPTQID